MRFGPMAGSAVTGLLLACSAFGGTIEGTVALSPDDLAFRGGAKGNAYVGQLSGSAGGSGAAAPSDTSYGVAYLAGDDPGAVPPPEPILLDQKGQRFLPRILAVVVGQAVEFRNSDNVFHNVFSYSPPKRFDLGRYPRGKSKRLTFQKPGLVQVFCDIHSDMRSDIVVVPSRRHAYVDAEGRFRIRDVPRGRHTLVLWLPRRGLETRVIEVTASGATAAFP